MGIQADFESFVVMGIDAEAGNKTINHQIDILIHVRLATREGLARVE